MAGVIDPSAPLGYDRSHSAPRQPGVRHPQRAGTAAGLAGTAAGLAGTAAGLAGYLHHRGWPPPPQPAAATAASRRSRSRLHLRHHRHLRLVSRPRRDPGGLVAGLVIAGLGLFFLAAQLEPDIGRFVTLFIGLALLAVFVVRRDYGFLVPGSILTGIGIGLALEPALAGHAQGSVMMLSLAGGFLGIWVIGSIYRLPQNHWWPLIPGGILTLVGLVQLSRPILRMRCACGQSSSCSWALSSWGGRSPGEPRAARSRPAAGSSCGSPRTPLKRSPRVSTRSTIERDVPAVGPQLRVVELLPGDRRGDRGARDGPHGVRRHERLDDRVLREVEARPTAPVGLAPLPATRGRARRRRRLARALRPSRASGRRCSAARRGTQTWMPRLPVTFG